MKGLFERKSIIEVGKFFDRSIKLARSEAINRNAVVRVQPTSASSNWSQGWHLEYTIVDDDGVTTTNEVIRTFPALAGDPSFSSAIFDGTTVFEILPNGQARSLIPIIALLVLLPTQYYSQVFCKKGSRHVHK